MTTPTVLVEHRAPVTIVSLNRPERRGSASVHEPESLDLDAAMRNEFEHGRISLASGTVAGAGRFAGGAGRHGTFRD